MQLACIGPNSSPYATLQIFCWQVLVVVLKCLVAPRSLLQWEYATLFRGGNSDVACFGVCTYVPRAIDLNMIIPVESMCSVRKLTLRRVFGRLRQPWRRLRDRAAISEGL